jgi:hypothetical protein
VSLQIDPMDRERVARGIERLLAAPRDLARCGAPIAPQRPRDAGSARHRELFEEYADMLAVLARESLDWWRETVTARTRAASDPARAEREAWIARPAGPASFPGFVAFVRDYWLECQRLNEASPDAERVAPESLLVDWLLDGDHALEVAVVACMPYWPIGLDASGKWI